jgi:putative membrane protein
LRRLKDYILLYFKGVAMGVADVIPGVSGGTIAFITGIYEELLNSIRSFDLEALHLIRSFRIAEFWQKVNGTFLVVLLSGIATSLLSLAKAMTMLLISHPIQVWSFFFGLILVSSPLILREIKKWNLGVILSFLLGIIVAYGITILSPTQTPDTLWFIFLAGAIAICAMILPGISGAFILLLLSKYEYMIQALTSFNWLVILVFALGAITGLLSFSRLLSWILKYYRNPTLAILGGFMLGSLNKVWPWKEVIAFRINSEGEQIPAFDKSVLPWHYFEKTGNDPHLFQAIAMMALGVFIVVLIEKIAVRLKTKP